MTNTLKKIWNIVSTVLVAVIVICAVFLMGSRLLGFEVYTVLSGSMEPEYSVGDLIYVKSVDANSIEVGDPITFILNEDLVVATHRVVRIDAENKRMAVSDSTNGSAVILVEGSDVHVQELWDVSILEGNLFKISPASIPDKCLEYSFGTGQTILQTWTYVNAENQTWILS